MKKISSLLLSVLLFSSLVVTSCGDDPSSLSSTSENTNTTSHTTSIETIDDYDTYIDQFSEANHLYIHYYREGFSFEDYNNYGIWLWPRSQSGVLFANQDASGIVSRYPGWVSSIGSSSSPVDQAGVMLDIDYGTYPFVTSSNPIGGGAATGSGYGPTMIDEVIGVAKAYVTRVGEGPFVTELKDETGGKIREIGHEYGVTTGRPRRCGWFDAVTMKYAVLVGGLTSIALTKIDVFDTFDEIKVCTAYKDTRDGKIYTSYPTDVFIHKYLEPVYETHKGWGQDISGIREYEKLPENCKKYLARLEELLEVPISIVSVGPDREQTIFR